MDPHGWESSLTKGLRQWGPEVWSKGRPVTFHPLVLPVQAPPRGSDTWL